MFIRGLDQFLHQDLFYLLQKKTKTKTKKTPGNYTEQKISIMNIFNNYENFVNTNPIMAY